MFVMNLQTPDAFQMYCLVSGQSWLSGSFGFLKTNTGRLFSSGIA